ncbi:hypothetical protein [Caldalkalibacillus salinus]|uniref:hypothetical protein n=1 Tax=Caldalkalibacillus salinus TaxID=2803787 RepID=UPI001921957C|nr:hypothetical protein [Caldalkalibacillus salinus]
MTQPYHRGHAYHRFPAYVYPKQSIYHPVVPFRGFSQQAKQDYNSPEQTTPPDVNSNRQEDGTHPTMPSFPQAGQQEQHTEPQPTGEYNVLDDVTFTLTELNKAIENVQVISHSVKGLDLASMVKNVSGSNVLSVLKNVDLNQISALLESPLVRQLLTDPEFLALLSPHDTNQQR